MLSRAVRLPFARGALRLRQLSSAVELKGIGQAADLQDVVVDGVTVIKMEPFGASVGKHPNLPSLPPKMHIDWSYLMADLDDDAKKEVLQMKAVVDRQQREIDLKRSELASAASVDWDKWATELTSPNAKTLLDGFKTEMQGWTFDAAETNKVIDQYRADLKEMVRALAARGAPRCSGSGLGIDEPSARRRCPTICAPADSLRAHAPPSRAPGRCRIAPCAQESLVAAEKTKLEGEIKVLKEQAVALEERMANVKTITIAELMEQDPEMAVEVEEEIRRDNWAA